MSLTAQEKTVKDVIVKHFGKLADTIEKDFPKNYAKKKNNFLITGLSPEMVASMVFTSSWESKCGNAAEACAREFAQMRYGASNVPDVINPHGLEYDEELLKKKGPGQAVITNIDPHDSALAGVITTFRTEHQGDKALMQKDLPKLYKQTRKFVKKNKVFCKPVDMGFCDEKWHLSEIKAGGDLDSTKAPAEVDKMLTLYVLLGEKDAEIHFATLYNKNGEGNEWKGAIKAYISPEILWIGKNLWETVLPGNITFERFEELYGQALEEVDLSGRIAKLIETTIKK